MHNVVSALDSQGLNVSGLIALSEGNMLSSVLLSSITLYLLGRDFLPVHSLRTLCYCACHAAWNASVVVLLVVCVCACVCVCVRMRVCACAYVRVGGA